MSRREFSSKDAFSGASVASQLVDDPSACLESVKQDLQEKRGVPPENQRLIFSLVVGSDPCKELLANAQAIVFQNGKAIGRLVRPRVVGPQEISQQEPSGGLPLLTAELCYDRWQPAGLRAQSKHPSSEAGSDSSSVSKPLDVPLDGEFRQSEYRVQVIVPKPSDGRSGGFAFPFAYEFSGQRLAVLADSAAQRAQYVSAQRQRYAQQQQEQVEAQVEPQQQPGVEAEDNSREIIVEYGHFLQQLSFVCHVGDSPARLKALHLRFAFASVHDERGSQRQQSAMAAGSQGRTEQAVTGAARAAHSAMISAHLQQSSQPGPLQKRVHPAGAFPLSLADSATLGDDKARLVAFQGLQRVLAQHGSLAEGPGEALTAQHLQPLQPAVEGLGNQVDSPSAASFSVDVSQPSTPDMADAEPAAGSYESSYASGDESEADSVQQQLQEQRQHQGSPLSCAPSWPGGGPLGQPAAAAGPASWASQQQQLAGLARSVMDLHPQWRHSASTTLASGNVGATVQPVEQHPPFQKQRLGNGSNGVLAAAGSGSPAAAAAAAPAGASSTSSCSSAASDSEGDINDAMPSGTPPSQARPAAASGMTAGSKGTAARSLDGAQGSSIIDSSSCVVDFDALWAEAERGAVQREAQGCGPHRARSVSLDGAAALARAAVRAASGRAMLNAVHRPPAALLAARAHGTGALHPLLQAGVRPSAAATASTRLGAGNAAAGALPLRSEAPAGTAALHPMATVSPEPAAGPAPMLLPPGGSACQPLHFPDDIQVGPAPQCDLERLLLAATPVVATDKAMHDLTLRDVFKFYEQPSAYGTGVFTQGGPRGPSTAYYVPYLSAMRLFTADPLLGERHGPGARGGTGQAYELHGMSYQCKRLQSAFDFFDPSSPFSRPALSERLEQLQQQSEESGCLPLDTKLADLHPYSWYAVAWYPVYRVPDAPLCGRFLTFHHLTPSGPLRQCAAGLDGDVQPQQRTLAGTSLDGGAPPPRLYGMQVAGLCWHNTCAAGGPPLLALPPGGRPAPGCPATGEHWLERTAPANRWAVPECALPGNDMGAEANGSGPEMRPLVAVENLYRPGCMPHLWALGLEMMKAHCVELARGEGLQPATDGDDGAGLRTWTGVPDYEYFASRPDYNAM